MPPPNPPPMRRQGDMNPAQDHGFMYGRDLLDPDGHGWGPMWMDPDAVPPSQ
jgi:uncharacterized protein